MRNAAGERHDCWSSLVGAIERYRIGGEGGIEESRSGEGSQDKQGTGDEGRERTKFLAALTSLGLYSHCASNGARPRGNGGS